MSLLHVVFDKEIRFLYICILYALRVLVQSLVIMRGRFITWIYNGPVARGAPTISHLLFANDCYLFFKVTVVEANVMHVNK